ncbi:MAG: Beta-lactamase class A-like protein [Parcubacteria group bacterium GW2011_GWD1_38_16]|nr:MAG: Beta-lactamase class A-like protein [Parcubacteria group bacterium GW2011_GWD1_38_16]
MQKDNEKNKINQNRKLIFALLSLVIILIVANGWFSYFYIKNRDVDDVDSAVSENNKYNLLNPARKLVEQEDLIINFQPLRDYLNDKYEAEQNVSIYFEYLPTGASIALNKDAEFYPASLLKVPVVMVVAKKIEKGEWKWTNELVLMSPDKDEHFGDLYKEKTGATFAIEELVRRSLSDSDNTAHFILIRNLEIEEISDVYNHMGLEHFLSTEGKISAKQYSVLLRSLYNASYVSENNSQKLLSYLSQSEFNDFLQGGLPTDVVFAHKIGIADDTITYIDSGIVYAKNRPYLLTVMVQSKEKTMAKDVMKNISERVYNYVRGYNES